MGIDFASVGLAGATLASSQAPAAEASGSLLLTIVTLLPLVGALVLALVPKTQVQVFKWGAVAISAATFVVSMAIWTGFDAGIAGFQMEHRVEWIPSLGAFWHLGVDGISLLLVVLTTFLSPLLLLGSFGAITKREKEFYIAYLALETGMIGALLALDLLVFYVFWEFMLIPMYLIIGIWGGKDRVYATLKFFIYTMAGSLLMLVGIIWLYLEAGAQTFAYADILALDIPLDTQKYLFFVFALAFSIKVPLFPVHTWLPDAHVQAPTPGSVILAGVLLKLGTYGLIRFAIPLFPEATGFFSGPILVLSVIGIVYGALVAYAQSDIKKLVAYSSVSHLGFVMLGLMMVSQTAVEGSILQMVNHGISTGALFLLVGMIYERRHTRMIQDYGGIATVMPMFATVFLIVTMSSIGLPGTNGFIGEFLILSGTFEEGLASALDPNAGIAALTAGQTAFAFVLFGLLVVALLGAAYALYRAKIHAAITYGLAGVLAITGALIATLWAGDTLDAMKAAAALLGSWRNFTVFIGATAATGIILGALYMLSMYKRVFFGEIRHKQNEDLEDLNAREWVVLVPLVALIFVLGLFPGLFLEKIHTSVESFVDTYHPRVTAVRSPETATRLASQRDQLPRYVGEDGHRALGIGKWAPSSAQSEQPKLVIEGVDSVDPSTSDVPQGKATAP